VAFKPDSDQSTDHIKNLAVVQKVGDWRFHQFRVAFRDVHDAGTLLEEYTHDVGTCRMVICLSGDLNVCITGTGKDETFFVAAGCCSLQYHPGHCRCVNCPDHNHARVLEMVCPAEEFMMMAGETRLGHELSDAVKTGKPFHIHQSMSPALHDVLISLRDSLSDDGGNGSAPLVLSKVLEVVWLFIRSRGTETQSLITAETRNAIEKARSILESNMAEPPALDGLAAEVGMSLSKLKQVFPLVFGMPPYAYLRKIRMEKAKGLLVHRKLSVTETAYEVGYTNLSHFAKAFTEHYGVKPSQVQ
jgi:AraC-like DNA-binding protein